MKFDDRGRCPKCTKNMCAGYGICTCPDDRRPDCGKCHGSYYCPDHRGYTPTLMAYTLAIRAGIKMTTEHIDNLLNADVWTTDKIRGELSAARKAIHATDSALKLLEKAGEVKYPRSVIRKFKEARGEVDHLVSRALADLEDPAHERKAPTKPGKPAVRRP